MIVVTDRGKLIRFPVAGIRPVGRATQGVRIMRVDEGEVVSSLERLAEPEAESGIEEAHPEVEEAAEPEAEPETEAEAEAEPEPEPEPEEEEPGDDGDPDGPN